jgi:hypothetical protein
MTPSKDAVLEDPDQSNSGSETGANYNSAAPSVAALPHSNTSFADLDGSSVQKKPPHPLEHRLSQRTVSREGSLLLRHPTPDLQSLQGAYIGNVERLEQSAERLSLSSDIEEEIRRLQWEQKKSASRSSSRRTTYSGKDIITSASPRQLSGNLQAVGSIQSLNSAARSGRISFSTHATSPIDSYRSPSWPHHSPLQYQTSINDRHTMIPGQESQTRTSEPSPVDSRGTTEDQTTNLIHITDNEMVASPVKLEAPKPRHVIPESHTALAPPGNGEPDRPMTAVSADSYQQRMQLFADFDGVHIPADGSTCPTPNSNHIVHNQRSVPSLRQSSLKSEFPIIEEHNPPPENLVYYPAPVPMMLNLPQRLSKAPQVSPRDKRRSQFDGASMFAGARRSMMGLPEARNEECGPPGVDDILRRKRLNLPPQLRAELFFELKPLQQHVEMKGESAVATLDSILDASAHAPISAFIDHPIVGESGAAIYAKSHAKKSTTTLVQPLDRRKSWSSLKILKHGQSRATLADGSDTKRQSTAIDARSLSQTRDWSAQWVEGHTPSGDHLVSTELGDSEMPTSGRDEDHLSHGNDLLVAEAPADENDEGEDRQSYTGPPTTLLAELQMRKQEQQQRGRTAATAFPNGMHSTLLEMDAVAQVQRQSRQKKHIALAWEDPRSLPPGAVEVNNDEDVPLGMLYQGAKAMPGRPFARLDDNQPLGLIAKRSMEDNEPLSQRRARLTRKPVPARNLSPGKRGSVYTLELPGLTDVNSNNDAEDESETLAQRARRLRNPEEKQRSGFLGTGFLDEVMSPFGGPVEQPKPSNSKISPTPDPEETLTQRRKRLQAEKEAKSRTAETGISDEHRTTASAIHTMADILQARRPAAIRTVSSDSKSNKAKLISPSDLNPIPSVGIDRRTSLDDSQRLSGSGFPAVLRPSEASTDYFNQPIITQNAGVWVNPRPLRGNTMDFTGYPGVTPPGQQELVDSKQRAMIDRWRQSVI